MNIHEKAEVSPGADIGQFVFIDAFTVIDSGAVVGDSTRIGSNCHLEAGVNIGFANSIDHGCILQTGFESGERVYLGPRTVNVGRVKVQANVHIGPGCVLIGPPNGYLTIGNNAVILPGSIVIEDVPAVEELAPTRRKKA